MTPILSNNAKNLKSRVPNGTGIFVIENNIYSENPISIE